MSEQQGKEVQTLQPAGSSPAPSVREVEAQTAAIHHLLERVLKPDTHYGTIPGTPKPTLLKPGAEKIGLLLHLAPSFNRERQWDGKHLTIWSECTLTHQGTGTVMGSAGAMCSTLENKYAYRQATRKCPECGKETIIKGKQEYGGGWVCFKKKGGCGAKWDDGAKEIESQSEGREENPNIADAYNTVLKMADKRAYVAATLFVTAASDIFTQDVEDFADSYSDPATHKPQNGPVESEAEPTRPTAQDDPEVTHGVASDVSSESTTPFTVEEEEDDIPYLGGETEAASNSATATAPPAWPGSPDPQKQPTADRAMKAFQRAAKDGRTTVAKWWSNHQQEVRVQLESRDLTAQEIAEEWDVIELLRDYYQQLEERG